MLRFRLLLLVGPLLAGGMSVFHRESERMRR